LDLAARVDDQFLTAGTQVPQATPGLVDGLGDVAVSSVLSTVRSSLRLAQEVCIGCTHTNGIDLSPAS
jgi:hypothetical protein